MSESQLPSFELEAVPDVAGPERQTHVGRWLGIAAVVLVMGLIWFSLDQTGDGGTVAAPNSAANNVAIAAEVGALAPDFSLTSLAGETVRLSDFRGKPVVLNFWATWCAPCRREMPALEQIWQQGGAGDVVVIGVDQGESPQRVQRFIDEEVNVSFPILLDSDYKVGDAYFVRSLPTTLFIDPKGFIQEIRLGGPLSLSFLQDRVARLQAQ
jgi:peroxiredoxin